MPGPGTGVLTEQVGLRQILIVEDEKPIREMIAFALTRAGFAVREAEDSHSARVQLAEKQPDLMLVDWMLPDMSGLELTRLVKREAATRELPVILLTARAAEGDKVAGLDGGADDYVTKPFSPRELLSRINAVLRRTGGASSDDKLEIGASCWTAQPIALPLARPKSRWGPPNTACWNSSWRTRSGYTAGHRCWTGSGEAAATSRNAPSTYTCVACARPWKTCPCHT